MIDTGARMNAGLETSVVKRSVAAVKARAFALVLLVGAGACSSQETPAPMASSGAGGATAVDPGTGGVGLDRSCLDGSDWCVWSCAAGAESGSGDSPYPFCVDGHMLCPTGSQVLSTCPPRACARFDAYCCDAATGKVAPPACLPDGVRAAVCADGRDVLTAARCVPDGITVSASCGELDGQRCATLDQECHLGGECRCRPRLDQTGDGTGGTGGGNLDGTGDGKLDGMLAWQCTSLVP